MPCALGFPYGPVPIKYKWLVSMPGQYYAFPTRLTGAYARAPSPPRPLVVPGSGGGPPLWGGCGSFGFLMLLNPAVPYGPLSEMCLSTCLVDLGVPLFICPPSPHLALRVVPRPSKPYFGAFLSRSRSGVLHEAQTNLDQRERERDDER